jgi:DnaJ-class molecular chaperone
MKKRPASPEERVCAACNGTGLQVVAQPVHPGRRNFPPKCEECDGRGRVKVVAAS